MSEQQQDRRATRSYPALIKQWFERSKSESNIFTKFICNYSRVLEGLLNKPEPNTVGT